MTNKSLITTSAALSVFASALWAAPLEKAVVASDAKWVLHLDFDALKKSRFGAFLTEELLQPRLDQNEGLQQLNLSLNLDSISSLTAYGPAFEKNGDGVLIVGTTANVKSDLDKLVAASALSDNSVTLTHAEPFPLYNVKGDVFVATGIPNTLLLAKSKSQIEEARAVLLGKSQNLASTSAFSDLPAEPNGFFFVGMAEGFNQDEPVPPQAQVLKESSAGRLVVGEKGDDLAVNLVLRGKSAESTTKIQQVIQGMIALVSMTKAENKELVAAVNATKINSVGQNVIVDLTYPVATAITKIEAREREKEEAKSSR